MSRQHKAQKKRREAERALVNAENSRRPGAASLYTPPRSTANLQHAHDNLATQTPPGTPAQTQTVAPNSTTSQPIATTSILNSGTQPAAITGPSTSFVGRGPPSHNRAPLGPAEQREPPTTRAVEPSQWTSVQDRRGSYGSGRQNHPTQNDARAPIFPRASSYNPRNRPTTSFSPAPQPTTASTTYVGGSRSPAVDMDAFQRRSEQGRRAHRDAARSGTGESSGSLTNPAQSNSADLSEETLPTTPPVPVFVQETKFQYELQGPRMIDTNYFNVTLGEYKKLYQYQLDIDLIEKEKPQPAKKKPVPRLVRRRIVQLLMEELNRAENQAPSPADPNVPLVTDYSSQIITAGEWKHPQVPGSFFIRYFNEYEQEAAPNAQVYRVVVKAAHVLNLDDFLEYLEQGPTSDFAQTYEDSAAVVQALNIICSYFPYQKCFPPGNAELTTLNGSKFHGLAQGHDEYETTTGRASAPTRLLPGLHSIPGFFRTIRTVFGKPRHIDLNVNSTTSTFYKPGTVEELIRAHHRGQLNHGDEKKITIFIKGVRARTGSNMIVTVVGLANPPHGDLPPATPTQANLTRQEGGYMVRVKIGEGEETFTAAGLRMLAGQTYTNTLVAPENAVRRPAVNRDAIMDTGRSLFYGSEPDDSRSDDSQSDGIRPLSQGLREFDIALSTNLLEVSSYRLNPPPLVYGGPRDTYDVPPPARPVKEAQLKLGFWNLIGLTFVQPAPAFHWTVVELVRGTNTSKSTIPAHDRFVESLQEAMKKSGITNARYKKPNFCQFSLPSFHLPTYHDRQKVEKNATVLKTLLGGLKEAKFDLVVCLLPAKDQELHASIKLVGDVEIGISTICHVMAGGHFLRPKTDPSVLANMCLKINLKMGRTTVNQALQSRTKALTSSTMIIGIDVTHAGSASMRNAPSIAAVVGSVDPHFSQWPASFKANYVAEKDANEKRSMEQVVDLESMVLNRLHCYEERNNGVPSRLLVYRDGLSEGQFDTCATKEYQSIQAARKKFLDERESRTGHRPETPPILLICCVKRHHTRLYPQNTGKDSKAWVISEGNPAPGTLVKDRITYGLNDDFFLVSQNAIKGTARPIHYKVLQNEEKLSMEDIYATTHHLCYLFGRATRSVGLCTPAYYADLAADRAREYVRKYYCPERLPDGRPPPYDMQIHKADFERRLEVHQNHKEAMFYI